MVAVAGLRGTGDFGADERPKDFREGILKFNPNGEAQIFALSAKAGKSPKSDPEFSWWHEGNNIIRLQVNGAHAAGDTTINVDSVDPTGTTLGANWGVATHLKPGDLLTVEPAADAVAFTGEVIEVTNVLSETQFQARRGAAGTSAASIANDLWITVIGSAYAEGTPAPKAVARNPIKFFNYTQIFKDTYELTGTLDATEIRTGDPWSLDKQRKAWKHSADIEMACLWGRRSETTGSNGKPLRTTGGLRTFIPAANTTVFGSPTTINTFAAALAPVFDFSTGAGDSRIAFMGNGAAMELSKIFNAATNVNLTYNKEGVRQYGLHFQELVLPQGRVFMKTHPLMSRNPILNKAMFVLDFDALKWAPLKGRDTKSYDDVQAKDEDVRRGYWQTEGGWQVGYGGLTMAYIGNISAT